MYRKYSIRLGLKKNYHASETGEHKQLSPALNSTREAPCQLDGEKSGKSTNIT